MRKRDVLSIVENPVRSNIILRLDEAGKAAYSDLLDSAGVMEILDSRGNFNYHLNFLLENSIVVKEGMVYRLTDKGRAIAQLAKEVNHAWKQIRPKLGGGYVRLVGYAEEFERETGIKLQKKTIKQTSFGGAEMVMDESKVLGMIFQKDCRGEFFDNFEEIKVEDLRLCTEEYEWQGKNHRRQVVGHPDLSYYLSPYYLSAVLRYIEQQSDCSRTAELFAIKERHHPFLVKVGTLEEDYEGPAFFIAPTVLED